MPNSSRDYLEQKLDEIVENLKMNAIASSRVKDGRVNSIDDEASIIDIIDDMIAPENIEHVPPRSWCDIKICGCPVNIKSTRLGTDNASSKEGVLYALTGIEFPGAVSWNTFSDIVKEHGGEKPEVDYYYIVYVKNSPQMTFWTSMKSLNALTPNGTNLPFQINWAYEQQHGKVKRSNEDAVAFIKSGVANSFWARQMQCITVLKALGGKESEDAVNKVEVKLEDS